MDPAAAEWYRSAITKGPHDCNVAYTRKVDPAPTAGRSTTTPLKRPYFAGLKDELANPIAITEYIKVYNEERRRLAREAGDQMSKLTRRNAEVSRELDRLIDAVMQGVDLATLVPRIKALEAERSDIAGKLQCAGAIDRVTLHPSAIEQYRADVERLAALAAEHSDFAESVELIEAVRRLVAGVIVRAEPHGRDFSVEVQGRLAQLTNSALFASRSEGGVSGPRHR